ncbi:hypothetical protein ACH5RR_016869 [Cinchona calisaya]|uniref:BTB domain-containing protein n=1 Tax=Cinchona calisaya TaxID=153742 RepID=A0ABD3A0E0_9GENT
METDVKLELCEKVKFLSGNVAALENIHPDIRLKPGNDGRCIPAHRSLLATRSVSLRTMLGCPDITNAPPSKTITLPELNYEELEAFLDFLYRGDLPDQTVVKHFHALSIAALISRNFVTFEWADP